MVSGGGWGGLTESPKCLLTLPPKGWKPPESLSRDRWGEPRGGEDGACFVRGIVRASSRVRACGSVGRKGGGEVAVGQDIFRRQNRRTRPRREKDGSLEKVSPMRDGATRA